MFRPVDLESLSVDELVNHYDATLVNLAETHAPLLETKVRMRPDTAWYNDDLRDTKQERRRREPTWRKFKQEFHKQMFRECKLVNDMLLYANTTFYSEKIRAFGKDQKKLFASANTLLKKNNNTNLPTNESQSKLAERLSTFFAKR